MILRYECTSKGTEGFDLLRFIHSRQTSGPSPVLSSIDQTVNIYEHKLIQVGSLNVTSALPLITCASVIFTKWSDNHLSSGFVYHAPSGDITALAEIKTDMDNLPGDEIIVVYAHHGNDDAYLGNVDSLDRSFPGHTVLEIYNLPEHQNFFGINGYGKIG